MKFHIYKVVFSFAIIFVFQSQKLIGQICLKHSHNDYEQRHPLTDAIKLAYHSIEIDVYYFNEKLVVSHDAKNLINKPSFKEKYLEPLVPALEENDIFLILLIDIKKYHPKIYSALKEELDNLPSKILSKTKIILTGDIYKHPFPDSFFLMDGRNIDLHYSMERIPWISIDLKDFKKTKSILNKNHVNQRKLRSLVSKAHLKGKKIRFWNVPNKKKYWKFLIEEGVDIIGVDKLKKFNKFLASFNMN